MPSWMIVPKMILVYSMLTERILLKKVQQNVMLMIRRFGMQEPGFSIQIKLFLVLTSPANGTVNAEIIELTSSKIVISQESTIDGIKYTITDTYQKN